MGEGSRKGFGKRCCCEAKKLKCGEFPLHRESAPEAENNTTAPEQPPESPESKSVTLLLASGRGKHL